MTKERREQLGLFYRAVRSGDLATVRTMHSEDETLVHEPYLPMGPFLCLAAETGHADMVKLLLELGADPNLQTTTDNNALASAAAKGHPEIVRILLAAGTEIDMTDPDTDPLWACVHGRNVEVAKLLLEAGADGLRKYRTDRPEMMTSALDFAWEMGARDIARAIAEHHTSGDDIAVEALLSEADRLAKGNTS